MNKIKAVSFVEFKAIINQAVKYDLSNTALISIQEPCATDLYFVDYAKSNNDFFITSFEDLDKPSIDVLTKEVISPISKIGAFQIFNFVRNRKNMNFLIHCTAGIHRSGAVAQFIHEYLTEHGKEYAATQKEFNEINPKIKPRKYVLELLRRVSGLAE